MVICVIQLKLNWQIFNKCLCLCNVCVNLEDGVRQKLNVTDTRQSIFVSRACYFERKYLYLYRQIVLNHNVYSIVTE